MPRERQPSKKRIQPGGHEIIEDKKLSATPAAPGEKIPSTGRTAGNRGGKRKRPHTDDSADLRPYSPVTFVRCHSHDNDRNDCDTKVWASAFEPEIGNKFGTTGIVASCGGNSVCFFDVRLSALVQKFNQVGEDFFVLAWSTVNISAKRTNILAAAGLLGRVTLLHPERNVCFAHLQAHKTHICSMLFHPEQPNSLFTGAKNGEICQWDLQLDIGSNYQCAHKRLAYFRCPGKDVLNMAITGGLLVAGANQGCYAWNLDSAPQQESPTWRVILPGLENKIIDGLQCTSAGAVVAASSQHAVMHVWSIGDLRKSKSGTAKLKSLCTLSRRPSSTMYLNVACCNGMLASGDDEGSVWLYELTNNSAVDRSDTKSPIAAGLQLSWPSCMPTGRSGEPSMAGLERKPVINSISLSPCGMYLVACTDNNLLCVWRCDQFQ